VIKEASIIAGKHGVPQRERLLVSQMQDRPLSGWQRARLRWHLAVCRMCRAFESQMQFLRKAMERYRE